MPAERLVMGWDIGGAHVKACLLRNGEVADVAQWACPLWQGMEHLERVLRLARERWPQKLTAAAHAITMTGEMTDLFENREDGVHRIAALLAAELTPASAADALHFYTGDAAWCRAVDVGTHWAQIASANWLATAQHAAQHAARSARGGRGEPGSEGVLIDIGSTTTDLIAFRAGRVLGTSRSDVQRLASGELVYQGVVRTPLCALAPRIEWQGRELNVMNEFFATTADVYRLIGELDAAHDLHPSADNAAKDPLATRRRLARMIGLDARDANDADWLAFAHAWRRHQVAEIGGQLRRVMDAHGLFGTTTVAISAGCGDFLAADVLAHAVADTGSTIACRRYGHEVAPLEPRASTATSSCRDALAAWAQVCAPSVAVATLFDRDQR